MPGRNPYRPGVGLTPVYLAGRSGELRRFRSMLRAAPEIPANARVTGLRGVGKTVLLGEYEMIAAEEGWVTEMLELEHRHDSPEAVVETVSGLCDRLRRQLSRRARIRRKVGKAVEQVSKLEIGFDDVRLSFDPGAEDHDIELAEIIYATVATAADHGRLGVILMFDEAQVLENPASLSVLMAAVSALQRNAVPVGLVVCGLPSLAARLLRARTYTERMFRGENVGSLEPEAARQALIRPLDGSGVTIADDLVEAVTDRIGGYPYFVQLWGAELWDAADQADVQHLSLDLLPVVEPDITRRLDTDFYEPRVRLLTPAEQDVLIAAGACPYPPVLVSDVIAASPKSTGNINVLMGRIAAAGVMYRVRRGEYDYTAPGFHEFLKRRAAR